MPKIDKVSRTFEHEMNILKFHSMIKLVKLEHNVPQNSSPGFAETIHICLDKDSHRFFQHSKYFGQMKVDWFHLVE